MKFIISFGFRGGAGFLGGIVFHEQDEHKKDVDEINAYYRVATDITAFSNVRIKRFKFKTCIAEVCGVKNSHFVRLAYLVDHPSKKAAKEWAKKIKAAIQKEWDLEVNKELTNSARLDWIFIQIVENHV